MEELDPNNPEHQKKAWEEHVPQRAEITGLVQFAVAVKEWFISQDVMTKFDMKEAWGRSEETIKRITEEAKGAAGDADG